jgi:hypothetical protein
MLLLVALALLVGIPFAYRTFFNGFQDFLTAVGVVTLLLVFSRGCSYVAYSYLDMYARLGRVATVPE